MFSYKGTKKWAHSENLGTIQCVFVDFYLSDTCRSVLIVNGEGKLFVFNLWTKELEADKIVDRLLLLPDKCYSIPWNVTCATLANAIDDSKIRKDLIVASHSGGSQSETKVTVLGDLGGPELVVVVEWQVPGIAVSMALSKLEDGTELIIVGLQFGGFVSLEFDGNIVQHALSSNYRIRTQSDSLDILESHEELSKSFPPSTSYRPADGNVTVNKPTYVRSCIRAMNPSIRPGSISSYRNDGDQDKGTPTTQNGLVAICFGGMLRLERLFLDAVTSRVCNELVMQEHQQRQLFALQTIDMNGDGIDEIISCAWDGLTCVYDYKNNVVRFQFESRVQGFRVGFFTDDDGATFPCFIYITFDHGIVIYTEVNIAVGEIQAFTLLDVIQETNSIQTIFDLLDETCDPQVKSEILDKMKILDGQDNISPLAKMSYYTKLLRRLLYNNKNSS